MFRWLMVALAMLPFSVNGLLAAPPDSPPRDEYLYLFPYFDTDGFAPPGDRSQGNLGGNGDSFDPSPLPEGRRFEVRSRRYGKIAFLRPRTDADSKNLLTCRGQKISVRTKNVFNALFVLGTGLSGNANGWVTFHYEDGGSGKGPLGLTNWHEEGLFGEEIAFSLPYNEPGNTTRRPARRGNLWLQAVPVPDERRITAITLPDLPTTKVFALTLGYREGVRPITPRPPAPRPEPAPVAIFYEDNFPYYRAAYQLDARFLAEALERLGIRTAILRVEHVKDPSFLTPGNFPVLVGIYGRAFPVEAVDALRRYRAAGGSMVHTGIPFTHPCERTVYGGWIDLGTTRQHLGYDVPAGMAFGEYDEVNSPLSLARHEEGLKKLGLADFPWEDVGLLDDLLQGRELDREGLLEESLDRRDEVVPLLSFGSSRIHFAAVVRHKVPEFDGAIDVWAGTAAISAAGHRQPREVGEEVIARAAAWLLREKNLLDEETYRKVVDRPFGPEDLGLSPRNIVEPEEGESRQRPEKIEMVHAVSVEDLAEDERVLLASAQGLLNARGDARVFLIGSPEDQAHLDALREAKRIEKVRSLEPEKVFDLLGHRRAVVVDPAVHGSLNLATMVGALEGLLVAYPGTIDRWELEVAFDLRGVFDGGGEMARWAGENLWPRMDHGKLAIGPPVPSSWRLRDHLIAGRVFTLWFPTYKERSARGAAPAAEFAEAAAILARAPILSQVIGELGDGDARGPGTAIGVRELSRFGKLFTPADGLANLSLQATLLETAAVPEPPAARDLALEIDKVYVAVLREASGPGANGPSGLPPPLDGIPRGRILRPARPGIVPPNATSSPARESFGMTLPGEVSLEDFGSAYGPRSDSVLERYIEGVGTTMREMGLRFLYLSRENFVKSRDIRRVLEELPEGTAIFVDHSGAATYPGPVTAQELLGKVTVFHDVGRQELARLLLGSSAGGGYSSVRPLFVFTTETTLRQLAGGGELNEKAVFVRPEELASLYRELRRTREPVSLGLIAQDSAWKYHDGGEDLGTAWRLPAYDDRAWKSGKAEFGYGDTGEATILSFGPDDRNKHPCYYFRKTFEVGDTSPLKLLLLDYVCDDGLVVYLNGKEVHRYKLPAGEISYSTMTGNAIGGSLEEAWVSESLDTSAIRDGRNTIAVEVHQANATSSDVSFNLRLNGYGWKLRRRAEATDDDQTGER